MKHRIEFFRRCFRGLYESLLAALLLMFFMIVFVKSDPNIFAVLCVFCLVAASYMIREWAPNNLAILLLHFVIGGVIVFLPFALAEKFLCIVYLLFFLIPESFFYVKRFSRLAPLDDIPWPSVLTVFIIYLFGHATHSSFLINCSYIFMIVMLFCYLLLLYVEGLSRYIEQTNDISGLPLTKIVQINSKIVVAILVFLFFALLLGRNVDMVWAFRLIRDIFIEFFKLVASVFALFWGLLSKLFSNGMSSGTTSLPERNDQYPIYAYSVGSALEIILKVFLVLLAVYFVYRVGKRVLKILLTSRTYDQDLVEKAETKKNIKREKIGVRKRILLHWSYADRIRRCYKYTIENFQSDIRLSEYQTCHDIESAIVEQNLGDVKELTEIYREVRYSNRKIDKKMLKKADSLSKRAVIKGSS